MADFGGGEEEWISWSEGSLGPGGGELDRAIVAGSSSTAGEEGVTLLRTTLGVGGGQYLLWEEKEIPIWRHSIIVMVATTRYEKDLIPHHIS